MTTNKVKLLYRVEDYPNFTQGVIGNLVEPYFDMVPYSPDQQYNSADTVILAMFWAAKQPETAWWYPFQQQGFKIVIDHLYDSDVDTVSRRLDPNTLELRNPNWSWYNSALHCESFGYHQYRPQKSVTHAFLMLLNKAREHKDRAVQDLAPVLNQALWSYVDRGQLIETPQDQTNHVIWYLYMNPAWYNSTAFSVVVESWMRSDPYFRGAGWPNYRTEVSEKIFKPLAFYHPFICYGSEGTCRYLRRQGFETFDNLWSEHYDNIDSDSARFEAVTAVILDAVRDHSLAQWDTLTQQKLEHNHQRFFDTGLIRQRFQQEIIQTIQEFV